MQKCDVLLQVLSKAVALAAAEGLSSVSSRALLQVAIRGVQQEAAKKSASDCSESDAIEDWDAEIEADHSSGHKLPGAAGKFQVPRAADSSLHLNRILVCDFNEPPAVWSLQQRGRRGRRVGAAAAASSTSTIFP